MARRIAGLVPRTLVIAQAKPADVARVVDRELEERGAILDEKTHARTVFERLEEGGSFRRGGYIGFYQPLGEKGVEVHVQAWATAPRLAFWVSAGLQLAIVVLLLATSPPSAVWFLAALVMWPWLIVVGLLYLLTFRGSRAVEASLTEAFTQRCREAQLPVLDDEQQLEQRIRERLEGEAKERELAALRTRREARRAAQPAGTGEPPPGRLRFGRGAPRAAKPAKERPPKRAKPAREPREKRGLFRKP